MPIAPVAIPGTAEERNRVPAAPPRQQNRSWDHPAAPPADVRRSHFGWRFAGVQCRTVPCCGKYDNPAARGRRKLDLLQYTT